MWRAAMFKPPRAVAQGRAVRGRACVARGHGYGPREVRCVRHVVPSQMVLEGVSEWLEETGVAGEGGVRLGSRVARGGGG